MNQLLVSAYGMGKLLDPQHVLKDLWIELRCSTIVGLCGMNRSGKTLAARVLSGELTADTGGISIEDQFYREPSGAAEHLRMISKYMGRDPLFFDELSIADNYSLLSGRPIARIIRNKEIREINQMLQSVNFEAKAEMMVSELPFGAREYCEILLTILAGVKLILLDEKLDAIYRWNSGIVKDLLAVGINQGVCFLVISNNLDMLQELCDEIAVIRGGCSAMQIKKHEFSREGLICLMTGKEPVTLSAREHFQRICPEETIFRAVNFRLEKEDPSLDFSVNAGEIMGILSLNNRWNQMLAETLAGRYERFYGSLFLHQGSLTSRSLQRMKNGRHKICVLPQPVWRELLFSCMSIEDNLMLPSMRKIAVKSFGYVGKRLCMFARGLLNEAGILDETQIARVQIEDLDTITSMRLSMERIRIYHPDLLIISGLTESADVNLKEAAYKECRLCASRGIGVLLISSDINEMLALCSRFIMIKDRMKLQEICVKGTENPVDILNVL